MAEKKKSAIVKKAKDIAVSGSLGVALVGAAALQSCGETEYEQAYTAGVHTFVQEVDQNVFKVTDERTVPEGESKATITYLDGREQTLSLDQARQIVEQEIAAGKLDTVNFEKNLMPVQDSTYLVQQEPAALDATADATTTDGGTSTHTESHHHHYHGTGLGGIFFWSHMGYMMGRSSAYPTNAGVYASRGAYTRAQTTRTNLRNSRVTRPKSSSRGFFKGSGKSGRS